MSAISLAELCQLIFNIIYVLIGKDNITLAEQNAVEDIHMQNKNNSNTNPAFQMDSGTSKGTSSKKCTSSLKTDSPTVKGNSPSVDRNSQSSVSSGNLPKNASQVTLVQVGTLSFVSLLAAK